MSRFQRALLCMSVLLVSVAAVPLTSRADSVIYSNLNSDPTHVYNGGIGYNVSGPNSGVGSIISAMTFTPGANYDLSQIDLAMGYISGTNSFTLELVNDNGNQPGTTVLESWTVNNSPTFGTCCTLDTVTSPGILLQAGVQYWLEAVPASDLYAAWNQNNTGARGTIAQSSSGVTWNVFPNNTTGAFDVLGTTPVPVPEPSAALLLGTSMGTMLVLVHLGSRRSS